MRNDLLELVHLTKETIEHQSKETSNQTKSEDRQTSLKIPKDAIQSELDLFYKDLGKNSESSSEIHEEKVYVDKELKEELKTLVGTKCSAPYSCSMYGNKTYQNAFVANIDELETELQNKLMVCIFLF